MSDSKKMRSSIRHQLKSAKKALRQEYFALLRKSELSVHEASFALAYNDIAKSLGELILSRRDLPLTRDLAKAIIAQSTDKFPDTERISVIISGVLAKRSITSAETDSLKTALTLEILLEMKRSIGKPEIERLSSLFSDIINVDFLSLTEQFDPLHASLSSDTEYLQSDATTQKECRRRIRWMAQGDELKACHAIKSECREKGKSVVGYILAQRRALGAKSLTLYLCYVSLTLILSLGFGLIISEWWAMLALILPSFYAAKSIVDGFILFGRTPVRLCRLRPDSQLLGDEKAAIVLHIVLPESVDTASLSQKLKSLANSEQNENIKVLALIDLRPEQAAEVSEDNAIVDSLSQMIDRLNEEKKGRFIAIIRKRKYSNSQDEYMGSGGRRGALLELCKYIWDGTQDFLSMLGDCEWLIGIKHIMTVNEDTSLEMGAASELLSIALHPANRPTVESKKVTSGYGIIVPKISHKLESSLASGFSKVFGLKANKASVYTELLSEGEFCGIGLINTRLYLLSEDAIPSGTHLDPSALEGELLRCAYAEDIRCFDEFSQIPQGYYRKISHSVKASVQNLCGIFKSQFGISSKLKLIESFVLQIVPISVMANMYLVFWFYPPSAEFTALLGLAMWLFPSVFETIKAIIFENNHEQQFYSGLLPSSVWGIKHIAYSVVMLATLATKTLGAVFITVWRLITRKRLLSYSLIPSDPISFYILPELISLLLLRSPGYSVRLLGLFFALMPVLLAFSESENTLQERRLSFKDSKEISRYIADYWHFFDNFVTDADNGLPPEKVQFSPVYKISHKTTPACIGLYLISCLAAYDEKLISAQAMAARVESCFDSLDKLDKISGCLFDSYDTVTLKSASEKLSSEEMGIYLSSLICLKEGLCELGSVFDKAQILAERANKLIFDADLSIFYDRVSNLMCKHFDSAKSKKSNKKHSALIGSSRLSSFYAIAHGQVPKSHWQALRRETLKNGFFSGFGSVTGSMEEAYLSEIYLKSPQGSACYESLKYSLASQRKLALSKGLPYGLSKSAVYKFTSSLEYKSAELGANKAALMPQADINYSVSPHSVFLSLGYDSKAGAENLRRLKKAGAYSSFGFFEAIDYTYQAEPKVVKMLDSRHVGAAIASGMNVITGAVMQKRFAKSSFVSGALTLLEERFLPSSKAIRKPNFSPFYNGKPERFYKISPAQPRVRLIRGDEHSLVLTDSGVSLSLYKGLSLYSLTADHSFNKRGFFAAVKSQDSLIMLDSPNGLVCEFDDFGAKYKKAESQISAEISVSMHESLPCEIRQFKIKNLSQCDISASLLLYIEPSLLRFGEAESERSRMSIQLERDDKQKTVTVSRANADCSTRFAIGFYDDTSFFASFDKESVFSGADNVFEVFQNADSIAPSLISEPEPCVFIKTKIALSGGEERSLSLFILCADSDDELNQRLSILKSHSLAVKQQNSFEESVMAQIILSKILFSNHFANKDIMSISKSFEADVPLILLNLNDKNDDEKLSVFLGAYKVIRESGIRLQMAVLFNDEGQSERRHYNRLLAAAKKCDALGFIYTLCGIIPVDRFAYDYDVGEVLAKSSAYIADDEILLPPREEKIYDRIEISRVKPNAPKIDKSIDCGGFSGLEYVICERPETDWHHVLSNPVFGTVLTNRSLGKNSFGDLNERLILELGGRYYDIINGAAACIAPDYAKFLSLGEGFMSEVNVSVSQKGMCKRIRVKITSSERCRLAYICENKKRSKIVSKNSFGAVLKYSEKHLGISADKPCGMSLDKEAFFGGEWYDASEPECAEFLALVCELSGAETVSFYLTLGASEKSAAEMPKYFCESKQKESDESRQIQWAKYQLLNGRIFLGDGFGVFKFSELLQDALGIMKDDPKRSRAEILRCCAMQFSEGDALVTFEKNIKKSGTRVKNSTEHIWLPIAVSEYIKVTQDRKILDVGVKYLGSAQKESVYEHCRQALDLSISQKGSHGLMLDENGRESVCLSALYIMAFERFCEISQQKGDNMYSAILMFNAKQLRDAIKTCGRDSGQYICGYLASGEVWGSSKNDYCKISLMPQVMAVLANIDEQFDKTALLKAFDELCDTKRGVTRIFAPPFPQNDVGAPKEARYLPYGIKQNGGQITSWALLLSNALIKAGFSEEAKAVLETLIPEDLAKRAGYKAEPYYICGEVYSNKNCYGKGADPIFNGAASLYYKYLRENPDFI